MENSFNEIQELLRIKADKSALLKQYQQGTPEIKEVSGKKYIYLRTRELGKLTSNYVGVFSQDLIESLLQSQANSRKLKKEIRDIDKRLAILGYSPSELSPRVELNLDFARINMKANIYDQAVLEGVATTYPQTETILENGKVSGMNASDIQKILNLKHAWEFILDKNVIQAKSDFNVLSYIASLINEGFYTQGGRMRVVPVKIGGSTYIPPIPIEADVKEKICNIVSRDAAPISIAIELCLYCMKTQIFNDGNKRASVIFANHFLISKGEGLLVISESDVPEFKKLLVEYYEGKNDLAIKDFMLKKCWRKF